MTQIHALELASLNGVASTTAAYGYRPSDPGLVPIFAYVVEHDDGLTLFDLGCCPPPMAADRGKPRVEGYREVPEVMASLGLRVQDVREVVLSHLHWDHRYGMQWFPEAEFLVQRSELRYAFAPDPEQWVPYDAWENGGRPEWLDHLDRVRPVDGWLTLAEGVHIVPLPGHTPGSQGLVARHEGRDHVMCGDLVLGYENWTGLPSDRGGLTRVPPGIHSSLRDWRETIDLCTREGWMLLPAHDSRVGDVLAGDWSPLLNDRRL